MTPEPGKESIVSKILFIGAVLVLLLIIVACGIFIYGYVQPHNVITPTPMPTPVPTAEYTPTPTRAPTPLASVSVTPEPDTGEYQKDTKVTSGDFEFYYPGIWDRYIVYDMFDGMKNYSMLYDTNSRQTIQVADGYVFSQGAISNGRVMLYYPKGNQITLYVIADKRYDVTSTTDDKTRGSITMFDTKLAYYQDIGHKDSDGNWVPNYSIYVFSMIDGTNSCVLTNLPKPLDIRIYNNMLVYTVESGQGSDVYLLDLTAKTLAPKKISTKSGDNNHARIYDSTVVYHSNVDGTDHIYVYYIKSGETIMPASATSQQWNADIYGSTIVYDDNRNGHWDIYAFDLNSHTERRITNENHDQRAPIINSNRIAYLDYRNGHADIYTMTV